MIPCNITIEITKALLGKTFYYALIPIIFKFSGPQLIPGQINTLIHQFRTSKNTLLKCCDVPDFFLVHLVKPVEVKMVPPLPTTTNLPFPYVIPLRCFLVPDFFLVQDFPFDEERMVPVLPTAAKVLFP